MPGKGIRFTKDNAREKGGIGGGKSSRSIAFKQKRYSFIQEMFDRGVEHSKVIQAYINKYGFSVGTSTGYVRRVAIDLGYTAYLNTISIKVELNKFVYIIKLRGFDIYKIGIAKNVENRMSGIQTGTPFLIELIHKVFVGSAGKIESSLHSKYKKYQTEAQNEWFKLSHHQIEDIINYLDVESEDELTLFNYSDNGFITGVENGEK